MTGLPGRVLVTGGAGFLGGHVVPRLRALPGCEVLAPTEEEVDLRDRRAVAAMYEALRPDLVVHMAGVVGGIGANRANPGRYFHDNMAMGLNLVEEGRLHGLPRMVILGTICAYPKHTPVPFREEDLWNGYPEETNAPYGIAKKALLVMAEGYREQYGLDYAFLLPVNLYGPGDHFDLESSHVIPALVRKCVEAAEAGAGEVEVWGTGEATREFLYVEDCAEAIAIAARSPSPPGPVNLGAGFEVSIRELAETIADLAGFRGRLRFDRSRPDGQPRRSLDTRKAAAHYGWRARTPLREGLRRTIDWYREHR